MLTCSGLARALAEPLHGTAPTARTWVALEQSGPWGARALTGSHLDPAIGAALRTWAEGTGTSVLLIRRPGRHVDVPGPRRLLLAHVAPTGNWLVQTSVTDPAAVLDLDARALAAGRRPAGTSTRAGVVALVCTNGRRDRCCAVHGRVLAAGLAASHPGDVWECTHLGGHRFAPTALLLPIGAVYGHLDAGTAERAWAAAATGRVHPVGLRGRTWWAAPAQVAEAALAAVVDVTGIDLRAAPGDEAVVVVSARLPDGRSWQVRVRSGPADVARPESCGKAQVAPRIWSVQDIEEC